MSYGGVLACLDMALVEILVVSDLMDVFKDFFFRVTAKESGGVCYQSHSRYYAYS